MQNILKQAKAKNQNVEFTKQIRRKNRKANKKEILRKKKLVSNSRAKGNEIVYFLNKVFFVFSRISKLSQTKICISQQRLLLNLLPHNKINNCLQLEFICFACNRQTNISFKVLIAKNLVV